MSSSHRNLPKAQVHSLISARKFGEAATLARSLCEQSPDDFESYLLLGVALMNHEKYEKARRVFVRALERFPDEWKLRMILGHVYGHQNNWRGAEEAYRRALADSKRATKREKGELHCSVAEALWAQHRRDDALAEWRKALEVDPKCTEAKESLRECTNEYGEPKAPHAHFDDLYHFQRIQTERYFRLVGREEFVSKEEAEAVIGIIMTGWNEFIAPRSRETDEWTAKKKSDFFTSVTLDLAETVKRWKG